MLEFEGSGSAGEGVAYPVKDASSSTVGRNDARVADGLSFATDLLGLVHKGLPSNVRVPFSAP